MPIDWEQFNKDVDDIIKQAAKRTDEKLAAKMSSITRLTDDEIQDLFPTPADVKKLNELMTVVKSSTAKNDKINHIVANAEKFGGTIVTLLEKFA